MSKCSQIGEMETGIGSEPLVTDRLRQIRRQGKKGVDGVQGGSGR